MWSLYVWRWWRCCCGADPRQADQGAVRFSKENGFGYLDLKYILQVGRARESSTSTTHTLLLHVPCVAS